MLRLARGLVPCISVLSLALLPAPAEAQVAPPLTLKQAIDLALQNNPGLAAAAQEELAAEAAVRQAGVLPNPELGLAADNLGNERLRDEGERTTSLELSQRLELGGKRSARVRLAESARAVAAWEGRTRRAGLVALVKQAFFDSLAWRERLELADDSLRLADQVGAAVARRVQSGKAAPVEETKAQLARSAAVLEREQARRELAAARARLAALAGAAAVQIGEPQGDLDRTYAIPDLATLAEQAQANPGLARWTSEIERRRAGVDLERARGVPDITLKAGVTRYNAFDDQAYMLGISIPLPIFDRNRGATDEAHRRLDQALDEQRGAQAQLIGELAETYQRTQALTEEVRLLRDSILPGAQSAFTVATRGYDLGRFGILDVLDAQRALVQARTQYLRALAEYQRGASELERLSGTTLQSIKGERQ